MATTHGFDAGRQPEQSLLESRARLAGIVQSATDAIVALDERLRIVFFNAAADRMFGGPDQPIGSHIERFVAPRFHRAVAAGVDSLRRGDNHAGSVGVLPALCGLRANGDEFPCEASIAPYAIDGTREFAIFIRDITERTQSEETLRRRIEFEAFLFDLSSTFIGLPEEKVDVNMEQGLARVGEFLHMDRVTILELSPDRDEMIVAYSWSAPGVPAPPARISRRSQPWWVGQVLRGDASLAAHVDDLPEEAATEKEYLRQKGVASAASIPLTVGGEIAGAISFVTVHRHESWTPETVNRLRAIGDILWNALKRRQAMQALLAAQGRTRESEERFRLIASTAPVIIWMSDADQQGTYINEAWTSLTGLPQQAALGDRWTQALHPDDLERCVETYTHGFNRREPFHIEYRLRRHDGEFRWIFAQGVPRYDARGSFAGYIGSAIDVTERKEAEELLSTLSQRLIGAQEQERSRLARELHDDINQRLAVLVLSLEIAMKQLHGPPTALREQIGSAIDTATSLASDVQSLSHRLHSSRLQTLGLELAARQVCREFSERSGVVIQFRSDDVATGVGEEVGLCLYRVLQEALQNAVKHSGAPHIAVSLETDVTAITLTVQDSGIGFEPAKALRGKGLGLVSMKERLKLVDGQLSIETHSPRGTTIRARVPLGRSGRLAEGVRA